MLELKLELQPRMQRGLQPERQHSLRNTPQEEVHLRELPPPCDRLPPGLGCYARNYCGLGYCGLACYGLGCCGAGCCAQGC